MKNNGENGWSLIGKYLIGECTAEETKEVENWLNQSDENRKELEKNRLMLEKIDLYFKSKQFNSTAALQKVQSRTKQGQKIQRLKNLRREVFATFYKIAAIILLALIAGSAVYYFGFRIPVQTIYSENTIAETQVIKEYVLPDGTHVTLNSNTKLTFPKKFKKDVREVNIIGEAFFDVKPNPEKPFIIHAGDAQVKVLGTSFNVRAYPENETVEVVVKTGKVQVSQENGNAQLQPLEVVLNPGEKGILASRTNTLKKSQNTNPNYLAWKTKNLVFDNTPLSEVVQELENVYHVKIKLKQQELSELPLTATFPQKSAKFILNVVKLTFDLNLSEENGQFVLSKKNEIEKL